MFQNWNTADTILVILLLLGFVICAVTLYIARRFNPTPDITPQKRSWFTDHKTRDHKDGPSWFWGTSIAVALLLLFGLQDDRDRAIQLIAAERDAEVAAIEAGYLPRALSKIEIDVNKICGPRAEGMTEQMMVIVSAADNKPVVSGCSRIAHRPYMRKQSQVRG